MASVKRDEWKASPEAAQMELEIAKAIVQTRNHLSIR